MLQKVMRHGFEFWEAPRNTGPVFEDVEAEERERQKELWEETTNRIAAFFRAQEQEKAKVRYGRPKENPYDREVWGDLADLSDEEPVEVLDAMGISRDEETVLRRGKNEPVVALIQEKVMRVFGVGREEFFGKQTRRAVAYARLASMALCRTYTNRTTMEIGIAHVRDRTAAAYAVNRCGELRERDAQFAARMALLEAELGGDEMAEAA